MTNPKKEIINKIKLQMQNQFLTFVMYASPLKKHHHS